MEALDVHLPDTLRTPILTPLIFVNFSPVADLASYISKFTGIITLALILHCTRSKHQTILFEFEAEISEVCFIILSCLHCM